MAERMISVLLLVIAAIHLVSIVGVQSAERLEMLYGVAIMSGEMEILMRHRAMLFGILGLFFAYSAFKSSMQPTAFIAAFACVASFFYLTCTIGDYNDALARIVVGDAVAGISLLLAIVLYWSQNKARAQKR